MKTIMKFIVMSLVTAVCTVAGMAATPADLEVEVLGPNNSFVYTSYVYQVRVTNVGRTRAENARVTIDLPLTDTSPNQYVLGRLTNIDTKCQLVNNKLECDLGRIRGRRSKDVKFTFLIPVSTKTLDIKATTAADVDSNSNNDVDTKILNPKYQDNIITGPVNVLNQHCTGTNLTSFYECVLSPSSVTDHPTTLNGDGTISFAVPGYTGSWYQPSSKELSFTYSAGSTVVLEFHGYAVSANCFEGLSTFPPRPAYVSPYSVCIQ
jgi:hypothetical protein